MTTRVPIDPTALADLCGRYHIRRLSFFGSVLRDDFGPQTDVDVLVEFEPEHVPGFFRLALIEGELSQLLGGRHVDLVNPKFINHRIRRRVLETAEVAYAEGWRRLRGPRCVLDMAGKARELVAGKDRAANDADERLRLALTHLVQIVGEAARHVSAEYCAADPEVPWPVIS